MGNTLVYPNPVKPTSEVQRLVEQILASHLNISCIPDRFERDAYLKIIMTMLTFLEKAVEGVKIHALRYQITFSVERLEEENDK